MNFLTDLEDKILQAVRDWAALVAHAENFKTLENDDYLETMYRANEVSKNILKYGMDYNSIYGKYYAIIDGPSQMVIGRCTGGHIKDVKKEDPMTTFQEITKEEWLSILDDTE